MHLTHVKGGPIPRVITGEGWWDATAASDQRRDELCRPPKEGVFALPGEKVYGEAPKSPGGGVWDRVVCSIVEPSPGHYNAAEIGGLCRSFVVIASGTAGIGPGERLADTVEPVDSCADIG